MPPQSLGSALLLTRAVHNVGNKKAPFGITHKVKFPTSYSAVADPHEVILGPFITRHQVIYLGVDADLLSSCNRTFVGPSPRLCCKKTKRFSSNLYRLYGFTFPSALSSSREPILCVALYGTRRSRPGIFPIHYILIVEDNQYIHLLNKNVIFLLNDPSQ